MLYERKKREALEIARVSSVEKRTDELLAVYDRVLGAEQAPAQTPQRRSFRDRVAG